MLFVCHMKPRNSELNTIRWIARITGTLLSVFILIFAAFSIAGEIKEDNGIPYSLIQILVFLFWGIALLALLVAIRMEGLGGIISLASLILMAIFGMFIPEANKGGMLGVVAILAVPSILYIIYWREARKGKAKGM